MSLSPYFPFLSPLPDFCCHGGALAPAGCCLASQSRGFRGSRARPRSLPSSLPASLVSEVRCERWSRCREPVPHSTGCSGRTTRHMQPVPPTRPLLRSLHWRWARALQSRAFAEPMRMLRTQSCGARLVGWSRREWWAGGTMSSPRARLVVTAACLRRAPLTWWPWLRRAWTMYAIGLEPRAAGPTALCCSHV